MGDGVVSGFRSALSWLLLVGSTPCLFGQVVQLPSYHQFSVQTSVLVPDSGGASLGGVSRHATGWTGRGVPGLGKVPGLGRLFSNRAAGSSASTSGSSVHVTIIDLQELDEAVLAEAERRRSGATSSREGETSRRLRDASTDGASSDGPLLSVAELRSRHAAQGTARQNEAIALFDKGEAAERAGHLGAAKTYFLMAARRADPALKKTIEARLAALARPDRDLAAAD